MTTTARRIQRELDDLKRDPAAGISVELINDNDMTRLVGRFVGPPDTPYANGTYVVDIELPPNYPFVPPKMRFETRIWHPNVSSQTGAICLDTLNKKWSPVLTIKTSLLSLQSLLSSPAPDDPQDAEVARQMLSDPEAYRKKAQNWACEYAGAPGPDGQVMRVEMEKEYPDRLVKRFLELGFDERKVVAALRRAGVERGATDVSEVVADRVVEALLG